MKTLEENIKEKIEEILQTEGYLLVDFVFRGNPKNRVIEVFVDGKDFLSANHCAYLSGKINEYLISVLDEDINYRLDVSSPGLDRPLKFIEQFPKHLNKTFEVTYLSDSANKKFEGKLLKVENDELLFLVKNNEQKLVKFNDIKKAKIKISFS